MTAPTNGMRRSWPGIAPLAGLLICLAIVTNPRRASATGGDEALLTDVDAARYRDASKSPTMAAADAESVYETALRFYRPPRNQSRRLDLRLLPAGPGDTTQRTLPRSLGARLVERLGPGFCLLEEPNRCRRENGAHLRVSDIHALTPDRVRVVVACRLVWPGNLSTDNGAQGFLIVRTPKGWRIADRHGVETPS